MSCPCPSWSGHGVKLPCHAGGMIQDPFGRASIPTRTSDPIIQMPGVKKWHGNFPPCGLLTLGMLIASNELREGCVVEETTLDWKLYAYICVNR